MRFKSTLGLESYSPVETIRQPVQCTLATQPGIIKNISRQQTPMNGRDTLLHTPQGRHMQVRMALKYMVRHVHALHLVHAFMYFLLNHLIYKEEHR